MSLFAEAEMPKLVQLVSGLAERMEVPAARQQEVEEIKQFVLPEAVLDAIEKAGASANELSFGPTAQLWWQGCS